MRNKNNIGGIFYLPLRISIFLILILGGFFVCENAMAEDVNVDTTWTKENSPYVIQNSMTVALGATLTINQGVVVKFTSSTSLVINGKLYAEGNSSDKIVFTSAKDDEAGGDTNGDGNTSIPDYGDWNQIVINSTADVNINHAEIKYGGGSGSMIDITTRPPCCIHPDQWNRAVITNSLIFSSKTYGIHDNGWQTVISKNTITGNKLYGIWMEPNYKNEISYNNIYNNGTVIIYNKPGWPPSYSYNGGGIRFTRNSSKLFIHYNNFFNNVLGFVNTAGAQVDIANNYWGSLLGPIVCSGYCVGVNGRDSISLVEGTAIYEPFLADACVPELDPDEPEPVIIVPGIMGSWEKHGQWVIDPILHTYDNLIEAMVQAGYVLGENLFLFPYDWRSNNVLTAGLLKDKIEEVKAQTGSEKIDIIAHSMGGLVSRYYVQSNEYENDVDQLILLDTPHQGAPESYLVYEGAYFMGNIFISKLKKYTFHIEAVVYGYLSLVKYIKEQIISTEQLLPVYNYLQEQENNNWQYRMYPVQYPRNTFLENLNAVPVVEALKQRADITNIISSAGATSTLTAIRVIPDSDIYDNKWTDGYPFDIEKYDLSGLIASNGDGTVPYSSLNFLDGVQIIEMTDAEHREIVTKAQQDVIEILSGKRPENYFAGPWSAIKRILFIRVYSPVDFQVIAPDGKVVGKNFASSTEINEISGAFYSGFDTETEFITIINPEEGDYQVKLQGTDNDTYELGIDILEDGFAGQEENLISGIISAGDEESFNFNYKKSDQTPKIVIQKEINFDDLIKDLEELYSTGEINKKQVYNYLSAKFRKLNEIYDKIEDSKGREKRIDEFIKEGDKIIEKLKFYLVKGWLTQTAYDISNDDIIYLINKIAL
ncbi:MAG: right-handed parallel beta-helix repeat-containing protein [Patescibacteria group bacterium]